MACIQKFTTASLSLSLRLKLSLYPAFTTVSLSLSQAKTRLVFRNSQQRVCLSLSQAETWLVSSTHNKQSVPSCTRLPLLPLGFVGILDRGDDSLAGFATEVVYRVDQGEQLFTGVLLNRETEKCITSYTLHTIQQICCMHYTHVLHTHRTHTRHPYSH